MTTPTPVHCRITDGDPFDFGTHANDFLLPRERSLATETFLVRVPGGGSVPEHVHTDMEQTFVFISGVGEATLTRDGAPPQRFECLPGDMVFVPTKWRHTVAARSIEGVVYVTVNAFVPAVERVGDSALAHAVAVSPGFQNVQQASGIDAAGPLAVFRTAETGFRVDDRGERMWARDFTALAATLRRDPNSYRVRRVGPFEYVKPVRPRPRILTPELADALFAAVGGLLPVYVEGSQSPISVKEPCDESDLDVLVAVETADDVSVARKALDSLADLADRVPVPLSLGVVHAAWLKLPNFYTVLSLDPASPDRVWWTADADDRLCEAVRRVSEGVRSTGDPRVIRQLLDRSLAAAGIADEAIDEWRLIPRWGGYA